MPHKDPEARRKYMRERYAKIKAEDPERYAREEAVRREEALKRRNRNVEKARSDFRKWYHEHGGKDRQRETHGYATWDDHIQKVTTQRKERSEYMKEWSKSEKGQRNRTAQSIKKRCGLSIEDYDAAYDSQEGNCAICFVHRSRYGADRLVVDHCHKLGHFRALLCGHCNTAIGLFREDLVIMKSAMAYVERCNAALGENN